MPTSSGVGSLSGILAARAAVVILDRQLGDAAMVTGGGSTNGNLSVTNIVEQLSDGDPPHFVAGNKNSWPFTPNGRTQAIFRARPGTYDRPSPFDGGRDAGHYLATGLPPGNFVAVITLEDRCAER